MTLTSAGFTGEVNQVQWSQILSLIGNDGSSGFNVSGGGAGTTLEVSVSSGMSNVGGVLAVSDATETVTLGANGSSFDRIDRVVLRADWPSQSLTLTVEPGTPSSNPQPPDLSSSREAGVRWKVSLAQVRLSPGHGEITAGDITREAVPPASGYYSVASINRAPDEDGSLYHYSAANGLYVVDGSTHKLVANTSSADNALPNAPANWSGRRRYVHRSGIIWILIDLVRESSTSPANVQLGRLPSDSRPRWTWYGTVFSPHTARSYQVEVETDGVVRAVGLDLDAGQRLRGSFSFPLG